MDLFGFVVLLLCLTLPLHWAVRAQFAKWKSPEYFRRHGVIILRAEVLDRCAEVIGHYSGAPIYGAVEFKGMEYAYAGVVSPCYRARIDENELYLDPGLLYRFNRVSPFRSGAIC